MWGGGVAKGVDAREGESRCNNGGDTKRGRRATGRRWSCGCPKVKSSWERGLGTYAGSKRAQAHGRGGRATEASGPGSDRPNRQTQTTQKGEQGRQHKRGEQGGASEPRQKGWPCQRCKRRSCRCKGWFGASLPMANRKRRGEAGPTPCGPAVMRKDRGVRWSTHEGGHGTIPGMHHARR